MLKFFQCVLILRVNELLFVGQAPDLQQCLYVQWCHVQSPYIVDRNQRIPHSAVPIDHTPIVMFIMPRLSEELNTRAENPAAVQPRLKANTANKNVDKCGLQKR